MSVKELSKASTSAEHGKASITKFVFSIGLSLSGGIFEGAIRTFIIPRQRWISKRHIDHLVEILVCERQLRNVESVTANAQIFRHHHVTSLRFVACFRLLLTSNFISKKRQIT